MVAVTRPEPSRALLEELANRLESGTLQHLTETEANYLLMVAAGLGFSREEVARRTATEEGALGLLRDSRSRVRDGSRQLMAAIAHSMQAADAPARAAVRAELQAIVDGPVDFYRRLAENELRKLEKKWVDE